jgi:S-DNA-T family DNA segregation ATPase FtsK/SpoIIIE
MTACDECAYVYEDLAVADISDRLGDFGPRYREALADVGPVAATARPAPRVWSALEYTCHVRDVFLVQRERAVLAQVEDVPSFARMYRDQRARFCDYMAHPLPSVLDHLEMASSLVAAAFGGVEGPAWERRFVYNWPTATEHDIAWLGRHTVHEGEHHLMDVRRALSRP